MALSWSRPTESLLTPIHHFSSSDPREREHIPSNLRGPAVFTLFYSSVQEAEVSCGPLGEMYKGHIFAKREAVAGHTLGHAVIPGQSK